MGGGADWLAFMSGDSTIGYAIGKIGNALGTSKDWLQSFNYSPMSNMGVEAGYGGNATDMMNAGLNTVQKDIGVAVGALGGFAVGGPYGAVVGAGMAATGDQLETAGRMTDTPGLSYAGMGMKAAPGVAAVGMGAYSSLAEVFSEPTESVGVLQAATGDVSGKVSGESANLAKITHNGVASEVAKESSGLMSGSNLLKLGGLGLKGLSSGFQIISSNSSADAIIEEAEAKAKDEEERAKLAEANADLTEESARMFDLQSMAQDKAASYEKESVLRRRRQIAGQARAASAANGVMLEGRAESSPAMFEQDAAAEAAYEIGKIDTDLRTKHAMNNLNRGLTLAKAANQRAGAANMRYGASVTRRLGNLRASNERLNGIVNGAIGFGEMGLGALDFGSSLFK